MHNTQNNEKISLAVRLIFWLPFKKRFSREEYEELFFLFRQETRTLMRRPQYVIGLIVSGGLSFYFLITGSLQTPRGWLSIGLGALIAFGYMCGVNSTKEYLCERLLLLKRKPPGETKKI